MEIKPHTLAFFDQNATEARKQAEAMLTALVEHRAKCTEPLCPGNDLKSFFDTDRPAEVWRLLLIATLQAAARHITLTDGRIQPWTPEGVQLEVTE